MYKLIVPTGDDLTTTVKVGMYAKLVFTEHKEVEGMWVKVTEVDGDNLVGTLSNDPIAIQSLEHGDTVHFTYNHVREFYKEEVETV
jgi:uncharacterized protein YegJ (DUF2314 family)